MRYLFTTSIVLLAMCGMCVESHADITTNGHQARYYFSTEGGDPEAEIDGVVLYHFSHEADQLTVNYLALDNGFSQLIWRADVPFVANLDGLTPVADLAGNTTNMTFEIVGHELAVDGFPGLVGDFHENHGYGVYQFPRVLLPISMPEPTTVVGALVAALLCSVFRIR